MPSSWLMNLASLATGRIRRSQKAITYTYTVDTNRRPKRCSSRSRLSSSSSAGTASSSRESSSRLDAAIPPNEIRPGYYIVYVGSQRKRFIISSIILSHPLFKLLLEKLEPSHHDSRSPDYHDESTDAILLPCEAEFLHRLLFLIDGGGDASQDMRWDELKTFLEGNNARLRQ